MPEPLLKSKPRLSLSFRPSRVGQALPPADCQSTPVQRPVTRLRKACTYRSPWSLLSSRDLRTASYEPSELALSAASEARTANPHAYSLVITVTFRNRHAQPRNLGL